MPPVPLNRGSPEPPPNHHQHSTLGNNSPGTHTPPPRSRTQARVSQSIGHTRWRGRLPDPWPGHWSRNPGFRVPVCVTDRSTLFLLGAVPDPDDIVDVQATGMSAFEPLAANGADTHMGVLSFLGLLQNGLPRPVPPTGEIRSSANGAARNTATPQTEAPITVLRARFLEAR